MTIVNGLNGTIKLAIKELQAGSALFGTAAGTDTYTLTIANITAYPRFLFVLFTNANTTTSTINLNGIGAITLKKSVSTNLASGDLAAGSMHILGYDGTNYQVLTLGGGGSGGGDVTGGATSIDGEIVVYNGTSGKIIKQSTKVLTTVGGNIAALTNPSAITFIRINADNSVTARSAANFLSDIGAVATTGNETIAGIKTFSSFPVTPSSAPSTDYQVANKLYVDTVVVTESQYAKIQAIWYHLNSF